MEAVLDLAMAALLTGAGRVRRRSSGQTVERTLWLAAAIGAVLAQVAGLAWAAWQLGRLGLLLLQDDLLMFLAMIVAPIVFFAVAVLIGAALALVGTVRRLAAADAAARIDLAVAGTAGAVAAGIAASMEAPQMAIALLAPAAILLVVVFVPAAWCPYARVHAAPEV